MSIQRLFALAVLAIAPLSAQLASPNSTGAAIGHVHLNVRDLDAQQAFWTKVGGTVVHNEKLLMVQFPGIYVILRKQDPTGGTVGSVVNHFGLHIKDLNEWLPKWKAANLTIEPGNRPTQFFLIGPDDVKLEIIEDPSISAPVAMHHIHMFVPDQLAAQAWYVKNFGAVAGERAQFKTATVPGTELTFTKSDMAQLPTKGRSLDHIGFEVKNIDQFVAKLDAAGIKVDAPIRTSANASKLRIAYIMDPWGTYIELTEGLPPATTQSASR
jgi:catechol 2,3-dioxygenase-like lactoylglutathione lyase family enzyme